MDEIILEFSEITQCKSSQIATAYVQEAQLNLEVGFLISL